LRRPPRAAHFTGERWLGTEERPQTPMDAGPTGPRDEEGTGIMRQILIQNPRAAKREKQSRKPRKKVKNIAHSGTATTAKNDEGRGAAKVKVFRRCVRCVAVRKIRNWLTAAQRPQRRMESGRGAAKVKVFKRCVRCVAVRKIRNWLTAAQRSQRRMKRGERRRKQKPPGAVFAVSL